MRRDAIIVGIDNYPDAPLRGCVNDAEEMAECLSFEHYGYNCVPIHNADATRSGILGALGRFAYGDSNGNGSAERDVLIFYFAGHGQVLGDQGHLVTYDSRPLDPGISLAHLGQIMESASATYKHVVAVLDSCHSGSAFTWVSSRPLKAEDVNRDLRSVNESRCVLAACRPEQVAYETDGHGAFTKNVVSGLLGGAANSEGNVTVLGLYEYVSGSFLSDRQMPVFKGDIAGTVILGSGFSPAQTAVVSDIDVAKLLSKGRELLDEYQYQQQRELADPGHRDDVGLVRCSAALEPIVAWFDRNETGNGKVAFNPIWVGMRDALRNYVSGVTPIREGQVTRAGKITSKLGTGGFGNVWRVAGQGGDLAYKVYHSGELHDEVKVERFRSGYENMRKLGHPRIVHVKDLTLAPLGIVMDYIDGANLRESFVDRSDASLCLRLMTEIAETVEHAHGRGVRHRDIKPENIIIAYGEDGLPVPFLTDFDLAYHQTNRTMTAMYGVGGVLNYAAPEQLHTPTAAAARAAAVDVYSLAQLMYFVITAEDPASDSSEQNRTRLAKVLNNWSDPRAVKLLHELYLSSSEKDPNARPQTVREFMATVAKAEIYVNALSGDGRIPEEAFAERVAHNYRGYGNYSLANGGITMLSLSQQVSISIRSKGKSTNRTDMVDIEVELAVTGDIPVASYTNGEAARTHLNRRLDRVVNRFEMVERHPGNQGRFQTFIVIRGNYLSTDGVARVVEVLRECVGCVDGA